MCRRDEKSVVCVPPGRFCLDLGTWLLAVGWGYARADIAVGRIRVAHFRISHALVELVHAGQQAKMKDVMFRFEAR